MKTKLEFNFAKVAADHFVAGKGRLPESREELTEWLMEFSAGLEGVIRQQEEIFRDHMNICNRLTILQITK